MDWSALASSIMGGGNAIAKTVMDGKVAVQHEKETTEQLGINKVVVIAVIVMVGFILLAIVRRPVRQQ